MNNAGNQVEGSGDRGGDYGECEVQPYRYHDRYERYEHSVPSNNNNNNIHRAPPRSLLRGRPLARPGLHLHSPSTTVNGVRIRRQQEQHGLSTPVHTRRPIDNNTINYYHTNSSHNSNNNTNNSSSFDPGSSERYSPPYNVSERSFLPKIDESDNDSYSDDDIDDSDIVRRHNIDSTQQNTQKQQQQDTNFFLNKENSKVSLSMPSISTSPTIRTTSVSALSSASSDHSSIESFLEYDNLRRVEMSNTTDSGSSSSTSSMEYDMVENDGYGASDDSSASTVRPGGAEGSTTNVSHHQRPKAAEPESSLSRGSSSLSSISTNSSGGSSINSTSRRRLNASSRSQQQHQQQSHLLQPTLPAQYGDHHRLSSSSGSTTHTQQSSSSSRAQLHQPMLPQHLPTQYKRSRTNHYHSNHHQHNPILPTSKSAPTLSTQQQLQRNDVRRMTVPTRAVKRNNSPSSVGTSSTSATTSSSSPYPSKSATRTSAAVFTKNNNHSGGIPQAPDLRTRNKTTARRQCLVHFLLSGVCLQFLLLLVITALVIMSRSQAALATNTLLRLREAESLSLLKLHRLEFHSLHVHDMMRRQLYRYGRDSETGGGTTDDAANTDDRDYGSNNNGGDDPLSVQYQQLAQMSSDLQKHAAVTSLQATIQDTAVEEIVGIYGEGPVKVVIELSFENSNGNKFLYSDDDDGDDDDGNRNGIDDFEDDDDYNNQHHHHHSNKRNHVKRRSPPSNHGNHRNSNHNNQNARHPRDMTKGTFLSIVLWPDTPHAAWVWLEQIGRSTWDGSSVGWDSTSTLLQFRQPRDDPLDRGHLEFVETHPTQERANPDMHHGPWTVGMREVVVAEDDHYQHDPQNPQQQQQQQQHRTTRLEMFVNLVDNREEHKHETCVGKIFDGFDTLQRLLEGTEVTATGDAVTNVKVKSVTAMHMLHNELEQIYR